MQDLKQRGHADFLQLGEDLIRAGDNSKAQVGVAGVYACHTGSPSATVSAEGVADALPFHARRYMEDGTGTLLRKSMKMDANSPCFSSQPAVETSSSVSCGMRIWSSLFGNSRLAFSPTRRGCVRSLPGITQVGTVIEPRASALAPMTGRSASCRKYARQWAITSIKRCASMPRSRSRLAGLLAIRSQKNSVSQTADMPPCCAASMN